MYTTLNCFVRFEICVVLFPTQKKEREKKNSIALNLQIETVATAYVNH